MSASQIRSKRKMLSKSAGSLIRKAVGGKAAISKGGMRLADSVLPAYEPHGGPLSDAQLATIRRLAGRQEIERVSSTLL